MVLSDYACKAAMLSGRLDMTLILCSVRELVEVILELRIDTKGYTAPLPHCFV